MVARTNSKSRCSRKYFSESYGVPLVFSRFLNRTPGHRPVSAPPGKFELLPRALTSTPLPLPREPDSPRVLEVVEKIESVSWKLEYNEAEIDLCASPNLKRKLSPHSPLMNRKSTRRPAASSCDVMSRSMMEGHRSSPVPVVRDSAMARSCISLSRSNSNSSRRKLGPGFEPVEENETETKVSQTKEMTSLSSQLQRNDQVLMKLLVHFLPFLGCLELLSFLAYWTNGEPSCTRCLLVPDESYLILFCKFFLPKIKTI